MKEYKTSKGWTIFIYLFTPVLLSLFIWLLITPFLRGNIFSDAIWILIPISTVMIAVMLFGVIEVYKGRILIDKHSIKSINTFSKIELKFDEIEGYRIAGGYIFVEPKSKEKKRIKISSYYGRTGEILFFLSKFVPDLDERNLLNEEKQILNDENFGFNKENRADNLSRARKVSKIINWTAGISAAWIFFYPTPYKYSILIAITIPIIAILVIKFSKGLIRTDEIRGSAYPAVMYAFIYPSLGLTIRAIYDYNIFDYSNVWTITITFTFALLFLLMYKQRELKFKKTLDYISVASFALFLFAYSFGTIIHINCYYDNDKPQSYTAKIIDKKKSTGNSTSYFLKLSNQGEQMEIDQVSVGKSLYNRVNVNDNVNINYRKGKFEIPWFTVSDQ